MPDKWRTQLRIHWQRLLLLTFVYLVLHLGLYSVVTTTLVNGYGLWFPPLGLMLAVVLRFRKFGALLAFSGALLCYRLFDDVGTELIFQILRAGLLVLSALILSSLFVKAGYGNPRMVPRPRLVVAIIILCMAYALCSSIIAFAVSQWTGFYIQFTTPTMINWFLGDFIGTASTMSVVTQVVFPLLMGEYKYLRGSKLPYVALILIYGVFCAFPTLLLKAGYVQNSMTAAFFVFVPVIHAGLRRGASETSIALFFSVIGLMYASQITSTLMAIDLQVFSMLLTVGTMLLSAITTHQRAMTRTLRMTVADRDKLNSQRTELEAKLAQLQKLDALGQMAGGLAHEINNLLHPVLSFAKAAADAPEDKRRHYLQRIRECAEGARMIVADVLAFARTSAEPQNDGDTLQDARSCIDTAFAIALKDINPQVDVTQTNRCQEEIISVAPARMTQLLINLVRNACDAMPEGGTLTLLAEPVQLDEGNLAGTGLEPGNYIQVGVGDTGTGMDAETLSRAFDPFFTTKPVGRGTGLGLSVAYGLARRWGGHISLESRFGFGTVVTLLVPIKQDSF
jgi:signal transduction histidine kinase